MTSPLVRLQSTAARTFVDSESLAEFMASPDCRHRNPPNHRPETESTAMPPKNTSPQTPAENSARDAARPDAPIAALGRAYRRA
jgi:hypothetical protein